MIKRTNWTNQENLGLIWILIALIISIIFPIWQNLNLPIFTLLSLILPLISLLRHKNTARIGLGKISLGHLLKWTAINLGALAVMYAVFEPWSGAYASLVEEATQPGSTDPTFAWLSILKGPAGWIGLFLFSGIVTIFAEELCFRGWLMRMLAPKTGAFWANVLQAALFTAPQLIIAFIMPQPVQSIVYGLVYAFLGIGMINGWVSQKAGAIWPNLIAASIMNVVLSLLILG